MTWPSYWYSEFSNQPRGVLLTQERNEERTTQATVLLQQTAGFPLRLGSEERAKRSIRVGVPRKSKWTSREPLGPTHRGNTYLASLPLVSVVRRHGRVTRWKSRYWNFSSSVSFIFLVHNSCFDKCIYRTHLKVFRPNMEFLGYVLACNKFVNTSYQNCLEFVYSFVQWALTQNRGGKAHIFRSVLDRTHSVRRYIYLTHCVPRTA